MFYFWVWDKLQKRQPHLYKFPWIYRPRKSYGSNYLIIKNVPIRIPNLGFVQFFGCPLYFSRSVWQSKEIQKRKFNISVSVPISHNQNVTPFVLPRTFSQLALELLTISELNRRTTKTIHWLSPVRLKDKWYHNNIILLASFAGAETSPGIETTIILRPFRITFPIIPKGYITVIPIITIHMKLMMLCVRQCNYTQSFC